MVFSLPVVELVADGPQPSGRLLLLLAGLLTQLVAGRAHDVTGLVRRLLGDVAGLALGHLGDVLTGAVTVEQLETTVAATDLAASDDLSAAVAGFPGVAADQYWADRAALAWS